MNKKESHLLLKLREECLKKGANGIKGIARLWKIIDDDNSKTLNLQEFQKGIMQYDLNFTKEEINQLFKEFDTNGNGLLDYNEFLDDLRVRNTHNIKLK
jgi:calcyphosin